MYLSTLSEAVQVFLRATEKRDASELVGLTGDAVPTDLGKQQRGSAIRVWREVAFSRSRVHVHPIHVEPRAEELALVVAIARDDMERRAEAARPIRVARQAARDGRISYSRVMS